MKSGYERLWRATVPNRRAMAEIEPDDIVRRVNAALDAVPSERRRHMRQKIRVAAVLAAAALALTGTALAAASGWNILDFYYAGDTSPGQALVDNQPRSISDGSYTLTVESSAADPAAALLLVRVDALTDEAAAFMAGDDFNGIDLWNIYPIASAADGSEADMPQASSASYSEVRELRTGTSTTWRFRVDLSGTDCSGIHVRMGYMEEGLAITVPIQPAQPVEVAVGTSGEGLAWYETEAAGAVTLNSVSITPLSLQLDVSWSSASSSEAPLPPLLFRMADGSLRSMGEMLEPVRQGTTVLTGGGEGNEKRGYWNLSFRSVQDVAQIESVVFWGQAYPLDGGSPQPVEADPVLFPFQIPRVDPRTDQVGYVLPVGALCGGLGIDCAWDNDTHTAVMTYRGTTISLTWGSSTALVDGQPVELEIPVFVLDSTGQPHTSPDGANGTLCVELFSALEDSWKLWFSMPYDSSASVYDGSWTVWP